MFIRVWTLLRALTTVTALVSGSSGDLWCLLVIRAVKRVVLQVRLRRPVFLGMLVLV